jgi:hypothetical protein
MLFSETAFLLLYSCKQQVLLWQQHILRTSNLVCSKQQSVLIISYKQLELVNYKLKISSLRTLMLIEQYIFLLSHSKIYSVWFHYLGFDENALSLSRVKKNFGDVLNLKS